MSKGDYEVGWGKPPKANQFQKGQSGNPKGRRSSVGFDKLEVIERIYSEKVAITVEGKRHKVSKFEAAVRMTLHSAMQKGDIKSFERVMKLIEDQGGDWRVQMAADARAGAEEAVANMFRAFDNTVPDDSPEEAADYERRQREELEHIRACSHCSEFLLRRWASEDHPGRLDTPLRRLFNGSRAPNEPLRLLPAPDGGPCHSGG